MAGVSLSELILLFVIGLLILGPERLPRVASQIGRWVGRARRTANQLRYQLEREIALADIEKSSRAKSQTIKDNATEPGAEQGQGEKQDHESGSGDEHEQSAARTDSAGGDQESDEPVSPSDTTPERDHARQA